MIRLSSTLLLLIPLLLATELQARTTTLKIATVAPDGTSWMREMRRAADEIKQRTEGRVQFRFYPGGIMGNDKSVLRKIRVGQLHGGAITGGGLADILPEAQVYSLPFLFRDFAEVDYVRDKMDPVLLDGLQKAGYIGFGISEGGFAYLMSQQAIAGIDDLQGHKVWVPEGDVISRTAFEATGTSPISLPLTDVLTGLQTGLVDTVAATPTGAIALQWHTRVKYLTDAPLMYIYGALVIQQRAFAKLSDADQRLVREIMGQTFEQLNRQNREDNASALSALQGQDITFVSSNAQAMQQWQKVVNQAMQRLIQDALFDIDIYRQLQQHLEDYRAKAVSQ